MRTFARIALPLALGLAPLAAASPASATETAPTAAIIDWCYYHDIEARVGSWICIGINYPNAPLPA